MAGSWKHAVDKNGKLLVNEDIVRMLENGGDWYEFAEEAYGMVWCLADMLAAMSYNGADSAALVEVARRHYKEGIDRSPGTDGHILREEE